jgi:PadR family transcriptional regulator PadR
MTVEQKFSSIRKGLLEFLVLTIISARTVYVADILKRLATTDFATQEGTLYPLLSKLRREGLVNYEWQESESGPPRKYYRLTPAGRQHLDELDQYWTGISQTVTDLRS